MTKIQFFRSNEDIVKFIIEGHTEFVSEGEDIVCAAISSLSMHTLNGLTDVIGLCVGYEIREAYLEVILPAELSEEEAVCSKVLMDSLYLSLKNLETQYGKYITITELEV